MFDRVEIVIEAGGGGDGAVSFRREKFVPFGGPDGGDGGRGGDVIILADPSVANLRAFQQKGHYRATDGGGGSGGRKHGKKGDDLVLRVPLGTIALGGAHLEEDAPIADLEYSGQRVVITRGGKGGLGNAHFVSPTNQAPRIAQQGEAGEEKSIILELRLIADVGIIGYPNVGKSSLFNRLTGMGVVTANYPGKTVEVQLGELPLRVHVHGRSRDGRLLRRALISSLTRATWSDRWQRRPSAS